MTYNRTAIMQAAWAIFAETYIYPSLPFNSIGRKGFGWALTEAWRRAKRPPTQPVAQRSAASLWDEVQSLENRTRLDHHGLNRLSEVRAEYYQAQAHEKAEADLAEKRELIASAKGRFCSVQFTKKDGTERIMRVQPATLKFHVRGDAASEAGKRTTAPVHAATRTCCPSGTQRRQLVAQ